MKMIHCADVHLDSAMTSYLESGKATERRNELLRNFERLIEYANENAVSAVLIAGDLFDKKTISAFARNRVYNLIKDNAHIDFYYLSGNHDRDGFLNSIEECPENLLCFGDRWTSYEIGELSGRRIMLSGVNLNVNNVKTIYSSLALNLDDYNLVTLHGQIDEYKCTEKDEFISLRELRGKGIDYLALGHVHAYSYGKLDPRGEYCYSGCLEGRSFDEPGGHGFVEIEFDEQTGRVSKQFIPFARRHVCVIPVDISDATDSYDIEKMIETELVVGTQRPARNDLVEIQLIGNVSVETEKNLDYIAKHFEDKFYYFRVTDKSHFAINYMDYENDVSLKGEFIRNVLSKPELNAEQKAEIINFGINALKGSLRDI